jgi:16S rRNA processing protein RimM
VKDIPDGFVAIGRVLGAWGLLGHFKIEPLASSAVFRKGSRVCLAGEVRTVESFRASGRHARLKLEGVDDRDAAIACRDEYLLLPESDLPTPDEGHYYRFQLIGLRVISTEGEDLGEITDVFATAANDVFVVRGPRGEILVPAIEDIVHEISLADRRVTIEVVPGLLPG